MQGDLLQMKVRKAIVLAAGHGTRLRPFTCATPKPLMPVWGEPMLGRIVAMLRSWGVDDIAFNTHCLHEQVKAWADGYRRGASAAGDKVKIKVSYEPEILGTGGVLNPLREWIADEPFYLVNGDIVVENAPNPIDKIRNFESNAVIGVALVSESGPRTIEVEPESGFVTNWRSQDAGCDGTYTYCGITVLKPEILKFVKPEGFSSVVSAYEDAMMHGKFVKAVKSREMLWTDAGTIPSYIDLNRDGDDNAFTDIPQVKAALEAAGSNPDSSVEFIGARGSERVFFRCDKGVIILYDDGNRDENGLYAGHARFLKSRGVPVPEVLADLPGIKTLVLEEAGGWPYHMLTEDVEFSMVQLQKGRRAFFCRGALKLAIYALNYCVCPIDWAAPFPRKYVQRTSQRAQRPDPGRQSRRLRDALRTRQAHVPPKQGHPQPVRRGQIPCQEVQRDHRDRAGPQPGHVPALRDGLPARILPERRAALRAVLRPEAPPRGMESQNPP
jgi:NDP-sugar pyrophosphorylase family protein